MTARLAPLTRLVPLAPVVPLARAVGAVTAALALTAAMLGMTTGTASAVPRPIGACTTSAGAVLAVDFSHWGGPILRSCGTTPTTGYELLNQGGWHTTGTGHDGPAFICRIGYSGHQGGKQYPTPQQDDCVLTPPASAYWSYWHADPGESDWEYSQLGAMSYRPKPGSVDLWIFGGTNIEGTKGRPTVTPDQLRAKNTRPAGGGSDNGNGNGGGSGGGSGGSGGSGGGSGGGAAPGRGSEDRPPARRDSTAKPSPKASAKSPSPSASTGPSPSTSASGSASPSASTGSVAAGDDTRVVDAGPAADAEHDSGSLVPVASAAGLVLLVGGAGVVAARRRRCAE
ncbi:hypothetical protein ACFT9I_00455 [Streptomyces sp. NPDC057137]|uniref:hypothetical protein n=1 Tax=Streptomyces sp. NPDC057137 TaxID=3346030 RepID=UPI0036256E7C